MKGMAFLNIICSAKMVYKFIPRALPWAEFYNPFRVSISDYKNTTIFNLTIMPCLGESWDGDSL
jgi:hypothetical protein